MDRRLAIAGGVLGGVAMLGVGAAVGSMAGGDETPVVASDDASALSAADGVGIAEFSKVSARFERLLARAAEGNPAVGTRMTRQAARVIVIEASMDNARLKEITGKSAEAMLYMGAGLQTDSNVTAQKGIELYRAAQTELADYATEMSGQDGAPQDGHSAPAEAGQDSPGDATTEQDSSGSQESGESGESGE